MKNVFEIKTETDLQMNAQLVDCTSECGGAVSKSREIGFFIHGYDPISDNEVEHLVSISRDEALRLIKVLELLRIDCR